MGLPNVWKYEAGDLSSVGGVDGVRDRVTRHGNVECCTFVKGFFADTLGTLGTDKVAMVFEDADLRSSTEDCVVALWPRMVPHAKFFCHEPFSVHVVSLFYDQAWWQEKLSIPAPGFFGSGNGIPVVTRFSWLGFAVKHDVDTESGARDERDLSGTRQTTA